MRRKQNLASAFGIQKKIGGKGGFITYADGGYDDFKIFPFHVLEADPPSPPRCSKYILNILWRH